VRELAAALADAQRVLAAAQVPSAWSDVQALAAHLLGVPRGELARRVVVDGPVPPQFARQLDELARRRAERVPLQHLTGTAGFRSLTLVVGPGVFVPRPETEVVAGAAIDAAAAFAAGGMAPLVVDLCTGSGAIALSVGVEVAAARVVGIELDGAALAWAVRNLTALDAEHPGLAGRVELRRGDAVRADAVAAADLAGVVDVLVANPPYIPPDAEALEPEVREHDPAIALYGGGDDGLQVPRAVVAAAAGLLRPGGLLVVEHAESQAAAARALAGSGWSQQRTLTDLTGRPRALLAVRTPAPLNGGGAAG
jgi:release factor glutamine methyltransferase